MSDTYYVRAYHNRKHINVPLEEKHGYYHDENSIYGIAKDHSNGNGYYLDSLGAKPTILWSSNWISFARGTDSDNFIGEKIQLKSIDITTAAMFTNSIITAAHKRALKSISGTYGEIGDAKPITLQTEADALNQRKLWFNFRYMIVQFDDPLPGEGDSKADSTLSSMENYIKNWYFETYIYYKKHSDTCFYQSCHQKKLRESSRYTGKFKILYHSEMSLSENKPIQFENVLPINKNVNIDTGSITHESVRNIYWIIIPPCYNYIDMSPNLNDYLQTTNTTQGLAALESNIKISYYDL